MSLYCSGSQFLMKLKKAKKCLQGILQRIQSNHEQDGSCEVVPKLTICSLCEDPIPVKALWQNPGKHVLSPTTLDQDNELLLYYVDT